MFVENHDDILFFQVHSLVQMLVTVCMQIPRIVANTFSVMAAKDTIKAVRGDSCLTPKARIVIGQKTCSAHHNMLISC